MTVNPHLTSESLKRRFLSRYVVMPNGCWQWVGSLMPNGYGRIACGTRYQYAHRISWFLKHGKFPDNFALHDCDNRACVNPGHLFDGTAKQNTQDAKSKNRLAKGEDHGRSHLTLAVVNEIRKNLALGMTQGECSKSFGVAQGHISRIKNRVNWND